jgi:lysophospholipase L1-like esterase
MLSSGETMLFIGDSITDCGRTGGKRGVENTSPLGDGYVGLFSDIVRAALPELDVDFANRGIGGNTIIDLAGRWDKDVIDEKPDILSIMVGINDIHRYIRGGGGGVAPEMFVREYDRLMGETVDALNCRLVILDPFYISADGGGDSFRIKVLELLPEYIAAASRAASKYKAVHIKTHEVFSQRLRYLSENVFCQEPVHPNRTGHFVIAWELFRALVN